MSAAEINEPCASYGSRLRRCSELFLTDEPTADDWLQRETGAGMVFIPVQ